MNYDQTLNLPSTDFPMRGNLPQREPEIQKYWRDNRIYHRLLEKNREKKSFILHDGPPYANGHIHTGHALNKTLKDIIIKFRNMQGYYGPMVHGWDTHGLPIEQQVIKESRINRHELAPLEFREKCRAYAEKYRSIQEEEFKRLGVWGLWPESYMTLFPKYEAKQIEVFGEMAKKGYIYRGLKPVFWCASCETALAEAEIEYKDRESPSIYVRFPVVDGKGVLPEDRTYVVIWTTTPWTLPANLAICLHPDYEYTLARAGDDRYLVASELLADFAKETGIELTAGETFRGAELEGVQCRHPFMDWNSPLILGEHVTLETGTGCVHTAPGHGLEDFEVGIKYDLRIFSPVSAIGEFTAEVPRYAGMKLEAANQVLIDDLKTGGSLLQAGKIMHQYPHCWRCKNPVIFRATPQWFASIDGFREEVLRAIGEVRWIPAWGEERIANMVKQRSDWCISRQRVWGVPLPIFYCSVCEKPVINDETITRVKELFAREGSDAWFKYEAAAILGPDFACPDCGGKTFTKEKDIMDVWFDSGSSHLAVLTQWPELSWPADLYLEGSDQHRGWFQSSLLTSVAVTGQAPYRAVLTHGFLVDEDGRKMSKSQGNVVAPEKIIKDFGADILRLWVASSDYQADIRLSLNILKQLAEVYRRIRNTARFLLGNLYDFKPEDAVAYKDLTELDRWALLKMEKLLRKVADAYENYQFHHIYHAVHNFCAVDLSAFYLDVIKDRLYTMAANSRSRRAAQTVLFIVLRNLVKMIAPVLVHTAEEIWRHMPAEYKEEESVHLVSWPGFTDEYLDPALEERWERFMKIREEVARALEKARADKLIGSSLEARVLLRVPPALQELVAYFQKDLATLFIVSQVDTESSDGDQLGVQVEKALGDKCQRCWVYHPKVGASPEHPGLCPKCLDVVAKTSP
ncbi:MAG TPA: isoleucine--tRNA ligase [Firmicutes bacterium]|jgi:isoleucyl-tRNA synthetase|nr:isoleucine--tRNA ligase [Bacillota bacterium]